MTLTRRAMLMLVLLASLAVTVHAAPAAKSPLVVTSDFPGGSVAVEAIDQEARSIAFKPALHPDRGSRQWWYFKVTGIEPGETLTLTAGGGASALPDQAAASLDNRTWVHTGPGEKAKGTATWRHRVDAREAYFAWGPPFVPAIAEERFARLAKACPHAKPFELCRTRDGHSVPALKIAEPGADGAAPRYGLWIQARQHATELGSSWICMGMAEWLASDDPRAAALRRKADVTFIPIMDVDNVIRGAGGKNEKPHDHNRDWSDDARYPSVAAAMKNLREMTAAGRCDVFFDLHGPGAEPKEAYFHIGVRSLLTDLQRANLDRFLAAAKQEVTGPLKLGSKTVESGEKYDKVNWKKISKNWAYDNTTPHILSITLEAAWNVPAGTQEGFMELGKQLGLAMERYLQTNPRVLAATAAAAPPAKAPAVAEPVGAK